MNFLRDNKKGTLIDIYVTPNSNKSTIKGEREGRLWIALTSQPKGGKANKELISFLSKILHIPKARISIKSGETSRFKRILVEGIHTEEIRKKLEHV